MLSLVLLAQWGPSPSEGGSASLLAPGLRSIWAVGRSQGWGLEEAVTVCPFGMAPLSVL